jgi:hypothetical protein
MRRGDVLAGEQAIDFHPRQQGLGSVCCGHDTGAVDIAGRDVIYQTAALSFLWFEVLALQTVIQQFEDFILDLGGGLAAAAGKHIQLRVNKPLNDCNRALCGFGVEGVVTRIATTGLMARLNSRTTKAVPLGSVFMCNSSQATPSSRNASALVWRSSKLRIRDGLITGSSRLTPSCWSSAHRMVKSVGWM